MTRWKAEGRASDKEFDVVAREALQNKLKQGWAPAFDFLGYASDAPIEVSAIRLERAQLRVGDDLVFHIDVVARARVALHLMYVVASTTSRGAPRERVYFLNRVTVEPGQRLALTKEHLLRPTGTAAATPGSHTLAIQVNGRRFPAAPFQILGPPQPPRRPSW